MLTLGWVPLTLVACINLLTGHVYYNKKDEDGYLRTWSPINEVAALIILLVNAGYLLFILFRR